VIYFIISSASQKLTNGFWGDLIMMYCSHCGKSILEDSKFCPHCGQSVTSANQQFTTEGNKGVDENTFVETASATQTTIQAPMPPTTNSQRKIGKNNKKWFVLIPALLVALIGGYFVYGMIMQNDPKALFFMAESKTYQNAKKEWEETNGDLWTIYEMMLEEPHENKMSIKANVDDNSFLVGSDFLLIQQMLDQLSLVIESQSIPKENAAAYNMSLNVANTPIADMEMIATKDNVGFKIPLIYDQYLYFNWDDYGTLMRKVDPFYMGPESLEMPTINWSDFKLSDKEKEELNKNFKKFLEDTLKEESFTLEKGVKYENGSSVRKVTLKLTPEEAQEFLVEFIDFLIEEKSWQNILKARIDLLDGFSTYEGMGFDGSMMVELLKDALEEIKDYLDMVSFPNGFTYTIFVDNNEIILERNINFTIADSIDDIGIDIALTTKNVPDGKDNKFKEFALEFAESGGGPGKLEIRYTNDITFEKDGRNEDMEVRFAFDLSEYESYGFVFTMDSAFEGKNPNTQSITRDYEFSFEGDPSVENLKFYGTIEEERDISVKDKYANFNYDILFNMTDGTDFIGLVFEIDSETEFTNVKLPEFNESNAVNLADLDEYELYDLLMEIESNIENLLYNFDMFDF